MLKQEHPWQPNSELLKCDQEALKNFQHELANGDGVEPVGWIGHGLYPAQARPILERAQDMIRTMRKTHGPNGTISFIYCDSQETANKLLKEAKPGVTPQRLNETPEQHPLIGIYRKEIL